MPPEPEQTGPFHIDRLSETAGLLIKPIGGQVVCEIDPAPNEEEIAALICEALNIHAQTNQTPSGLLAQRDAFSDLLLLALPYIETAELDEGYKPGAVAKITKQIRSALGLTLAKEGGPK